MKWNIRVLALPLLKGSVLHLRRSASRNSRLQIQNSK
jgi:hypothetical protein